MRGTEERIKEAHRAYAALTGEFVNRAERTMQEIRAVSPELKAEALLLEIEGFVRHARRQMEQITRRVLGGEKISHEEKVFSLFEPHTDWICKGKAGVPQELGLRVGIVEDQYQFILHHRVMEKETDVRMRRQHSAVESAINALENHGSDRCPDHGIYGFKRYVALAVLGRNLQRLGHVLQQKELKRQGQKERQRLRAA